jgi:hypothetical protein
MNEEQTALEMQVNEKGKDVHTESYPMSIGEIKNIYEEGDLDLAPEFQRFFRWSDEQKYKLIESLLLGIPLPSFFVSQRKDGIWDLVDGLQRLSTIFEFMGVLKNEEGKKLPQLVLKGTKYLPALANMSWENPENRKLEIPETIKREFKRKKLDFNIILKQSDETTKYELFERLNTGGSSATSQEVRNAILVKTNKPLLKTLTELAELENFRETTQLSDTNIDERYDLELVTRFILLRTVDLTLLNEIPVSDYLTDELIKRAKDKEIDWEGEKQVFAKTFSMIAETLKSEAFKKYNVKKKRFEGGFIVSSFEVVALGIGYNPEKIKVADIRDKVIEFWTNKEDGKIKWSGRNTTNRLQITLNYGRQLFQ